MRKEFCDFCKDELEIADHIDNSFFGRIEYPIYQNKRQ